MEDTKKELTGKMKDVMDAIGAMTVLELADFVKALEEKFGVTAAAPVAVAAAGGAAGRRNVPCRTAPGGDQGRETLSGRDD